MVKDTHTRRLVIPAWATLRRDCASGRIAPLALWSRRTSDDNRLWLACSQLALSHLLAAGNIFAQEGLSHDGYFEAKPSSYPPTQDLYFTGRLRIMVKVSDLDIARMIEWRVTIR